VEVINVNADTMQQREKEMFLVHSIFAVADVRLFRAQDLIEHSRLSLHSLLKTGRLLRLTGMFDNEAALPMCAIELMKAIFIWRLEKASLGRGLFRLGLGCTARKKQQRKRKE
jgi:hypothetical protein